MWSRYLGAPAEMLSGDKLATDESIWVDIVLWPDKGRYGNQGRDLPAASIVHVCACSDVFVCSLAATTSDNALTITTLA